MKKKKSLIGFLGKGALVLEEKILAAQKPKVSSAAPMDPKAYAAYRKKKKENREET